MTSQSGMGIAFSENKAGDAKRRAEKISVSRASWGSCQQSLQKTWLSKSKAALVGSFFNKEDQMDVSLRIGTVWALTFTLCAVLLSAAYWSPHWGNDPFLANSRRQLHVW